MSPTHNAHRKLSSCQGLFLDQFDKQTCPQGPTAWWGGRDPCLLGSPESQGRGIIPNKEWWSQQKLAFHLIWQLE